MEGIYLAGTVVEVRVCIEPGANLPWVKVSPVSG